MHNSEAVKTAGVISIAGSLLDYNDSAIYENDERLYIATNTTSYLETQASPYPDLARTTRLTTLDSNMHIVHEVRDIAPNIEIAAIDYIGDRAYLIPRGSFPEKYSLHQTYIQDDPIIALDMSDSSAPRILGEIMIPGFSMYLDAVTQQHILGYSIDLTDFGTGITRDEGVKLTLYNVEDILNPREQTSESLGGMNSNLLYSDYGSPFLIDTEDQLIGISVSRTSQNDTQATQSTDDYTDIPQVHGLYAYRYNVGTGLEPLGFIQHYTDNSVDPFKYDISRFLRSGSTIITISPATLQTHILHDNTIEFGDQLNAEEIRTSGN